MLVIMLFEESVVPVLSRLSVVSRIAEASIQPKKETASKEKKIIPDSKISITTESRDLMPRMHMHGRQSLVNDAEKVSDVNRTHSLFLNDIPELPKEPTSRQHVKSIFV